MQINSHAFKWNYLKKIFIFSCSNLRFAIERVQNLAQTVYNGVVLITSPSTKIPSAFQSAISVAASLDKNFEKEVTVLPVDNIAGGRLIHASTGKIDPDYDDVRIFKDTAYKAIKRALSAGVTKPIIVVEKYEPFKNCELVTLLGALEALYVVSIIQLLYLKLNFHVSSSKTINFLTLS